MSKVIFANKDTQALINRVASRITSGLVLYPSNFKTVENIDLDRLKKTLKEIVDFKWTDENYKKEFYIQTSPTNYTGNGKKEKIKKALNIAASFFADKQELLPFKISTIKSRISNIWLLEMGMQHPDTQRYIKGLVSMVSGFIKAIDKYKSTLNQHGESSIKKEYELDDESIGKMKVINVAGLPHDIAERWINFIKKATKYIDSFLVYGEVRLSTSKELRGSRTLAHYMPQFDNVSIVTDKKDQDAVWSLVHEFGHRYWFKFLSNDKKTEIIRIFNSLKKGSFLSTKQILDGAMAYMFNIQQNSPLAKPLYELEQKNVEIASEIKTAVSRLKREFDYALDKFRLLDSENNTSFFSEYTDEKLTYILAEIIGSYKLPEKFKLIPREMRFEIGIIIKDLAKAEDAVLSPLYYRIKNFTTDKDAFPSEYSKTDHLEFFAENYAAYKLGKPISSAMKEVFES